jgi:hypothetical protein
MQRVHLIGLLPAGALIVALSAAPQLRADVTVQEQTSFDMSVMKMHGSSTEYTTDDKQRRDNDMHCEGFMSMFCGNAATGHIVRLDKDVEWQLEPSKKQYRETPIPTAAQRQAAMQAAQAEMEKMKQCPAVQQQPNAQPAPDTSKCEMTPPKFEVKQPGTHATVAGHDTQLTQLAMTQSCTNKQTGDSCDFMLVFDTWLTQEQLPGADDRRAFHTNYAKKMGLDASSLAANPQQMQQMQRFLAPYADAMKEISSKAGDFKGYPLKTSLRIAFGGPNCAAAKNAQTSGGGGSNGNVVGDAGQAAESAGASASAGAAGAGAGTAAANAAGNGVGGSILGSAASAFGSKLVTGMFAKKNSSSGSSNAASSPTPGASPLPPGMIQAAAITMETTSIAQGAIPATQFDIPAGWKLDVPPPAKQHEFTCPKSGG